MKAKTRILPATKRPLPRPFSFEWAQGQVVDEASIKCKLGNHSWEPTIQLLRYDDGTENLRLCVFHGKRFSRMPLLISPEELTALMTEASRHPRIKTFLTNSIKLGFKPPIPPVVRAKAGRAKWGKEAFPDSGESTFGH